MYSFIKDNGAGILLCFLIAVPCWFLGRIFPVIGGPVFSILLGMLLALILKDRKRTAAGILFTSKKILQLAVILLGFGLNLSTIAKTGAQSLPIIISTIATSLVVSFIISRAMHIPGKISALIGIGSSICGGSAIAAAAPVIGADDEEIAQSISVIFLFNVIAALIFPALGMLFGLSDTGFGLFAGTAINDTSSVTAAAAAWDGMHPGANTLDMATIVKLTRTLAIIPITLALAIYRMKNEKANAGNSFQFNKVFPMFIVYFILASVITTAVTMLYAANAPAMAAANTAFGWLKNASKFFIIMAMAAIGLNTNIVKLVKSGAKPIVLGLCCWICIALVSLGMQHVLHIW